MVHGSCEPPWHTLTIFAMFSWYVTRGVASYVTPICRLNWSGSMNAPGRSNLPVYGSGTTSDPVQLVASACVPVPPKGYRGSPARPAPPARAPQVDGSNPYVVSGAPYGCPEWNCRD